MDTIVDKQSMRYVALAFPLAALFCILAAPNRFGPPLGVFSGGVYAFSIFSAITAYCALAPRAQRLFEGFGTAFSPSVLLACLAPISAIVTTVMSDSESGLAIVPAIILGICLGCGISAGLLERLQDYRALPPERCLLYACISFALAAVISLPCALAPVTNNWVWGWYGIVCVGLTVSTVALRATAEPSLETDFATTHALEANAAAVQTSTSDSMSITTLLSTIWPPLTAFALSVMSMSLTWGALFVSITSTVPPLFSTLIGWMIPVGIAVILISRDVVPVKLDVFRHVSMPVLAAMIVILWMVGDVTEISFWAAVVKGVCSGAVCAMTFCLAWTTLNEQVGDGRVCSDGLAVCFFCGAAILSIHALVGQSASARIIPILSLVFLVAVCVDAVVSIGRATEIESVAAHADTLTPSEPSDATQSGAISLNMRKAVDDVVSEFGLSPREREVLGYLVGGRTVEGIARAMGISPHTVRAHVRHIHEKLSVSSRDEIVRLVEERIPRQ